MLIQTNAGDRKDPEILRAEGHEFERLTIMVPMRDGVRLATDIYLPRNAGPLPVILHRTPYGRDQTSGAEVTRDDPDPMSPMALAAYFGAAGFVLVMQDCRGRYGSEGKFVKYVSDQTDGYDVCAWLVAQPWCNGQICTMGLSYDAHLQGSLGCLNPPGLVGQVLDCGALWNSWKTGTRAFGVFEIKQATWAMNGALSSPEARANPVMMAALKSEDMGAWLHNLPWRRGHSPLRHHPEYEDYLFDQWEHGVFDDYWRKLGIWTEGWHKDYSDAALVHMSGWYDPYVLNVTENYVGLKAAGKGPQKLILGAFTHGRRSEHWAGDVDFGRDAALDSWAGDWRRYRLAFFKEVTNGIPSGEPPVRIFIMGGGSGRKTAEGRLDHGGRWVSAADWPLPQTRFTDYFLTDNGALTTDAPKAKADPFTYDFDPANPVPTIGGNLASLQPYAMPGGFDQVESPNVFGAKPPYLPLAARPDVLVFQTAPLLHGLDIAGPITVELSVASDALDTDFTAKLIDVYPPNADYPSGYALNLTDGIVRLRYVEDPTREIFNEPGKVRRIEIVLPPVANHFAPGHRIRLDISSSNFPKFEVNSNTGKAEHEVRYRQVARNRVHVDSANPSCIKLPLVPVP